MERARSDQAATTPTRIGGLIAIGIIVAILVLGTLLWRLMGQHVNLVVVNESGQPIEFAWQPDLFAGMASVTRSGCESSSMDLRAGLEWTLTAHDGNVILESSDVGVPFLGPRVAVEVRLDPQGAVSVAPARAVSDALDAPYPDCIGETAAED